jgi:hypothetical protein
VKILKKLRIRWQMGRLESIFDNIGWGEMKRSRYK